MVGVMRRRLIKVGLLGLLGVSYGAVHAAPQVEALKTKDGTILEATWDDQHRLTNLQWVGTDGRRVAAVDPSFLQG